MTKFKINLILMAIATVSMAACSTSPDSSTSTEQTSEKDKEYTSTYTCPMHCEGSGSEVAGECPVCGMEYVKTGE
ncbi:MAG: heavy metal-binding domain-containing protein [Flavobacteriales bacterium]